MKSRASIPIGTIVLIAIVIIAGFGIYWLFFRDDCSDVKYIDDPQAGYIWYYESRDTLGIRYSKTASSACWWDYDINNWVCTQVYSDIDDLRTLVAKNPYNWSESDKSELLRVIDCIKKDCPKCEEIK